MNKNKTTSVIKNEQQWHFIDASGRVLGDLATQVAKIILGKNKAIFTPNMNTGDKVVITNSDKIVVTGKKMKDKIYHWHTGFPGGIKEETLEQAMKKSSADVIRRAIYGMLPKNKLRDVRIKNLHVYKGNEHPHTAQQK